MKLFYTTNFDNFLEEELTHQRVEHDVIDSERMARQLSERRRPQVRKVHGSINSDWDDLVVTRSDFASLPSTRPILFQSLGADLISYVFLFVGYSLRDPDFSSVYNSYFATMKGKHQVHFLALLDDPGSHETEDLHRRGLLPVDVWNYRGDTRTEKLCTFLRSLVNATSEQTHLRRFYRGLEAYDNVPIVVTSHLQSPERYMAYPACDIDVAHQISADLQKLSITSEIVSDQRALGDVNRFLSDHLILICSPFGNQFTKHVFDQAAHIQCAIRQKFIELKDKRRAIVANGVEYPSDNPNAPAAGDRIEHVLIARYQSPWANGKYIYVFAGLQALGTYAAGSFMRQPDSYRWLAENADGGDIVAILPVSYSEYDPYNSQFVVGQAVRLLTFN